LFNAIWVKRSKRTSSKWKKYRITEDGRSNAREGGKNHGGGWGEAPAGHRRYL